jgi:hypothetical protein
VGGPQPRSESAGPQAGGDRPPLGLAGDLAGRFLERFSLPENAAALHKRAKLREMPGAESSPLHKSLPPGSEGTCDCLAVVNFPTTNGNHFEAFQAKKKLRNRSPSIETTDSRRQREKRLNCGATDSPRESGGEEAPFPMTNPTIERTAKTNPCNLGFRTRKNK